MKTAVKTASVLAFERKLDPSDALFFSGSWESIGAKESWSPVPVREKSVRGTISNRLKTEKEQDPAKIDAAIQNPNLQTVDVATLPPESDTLKVHFSFRVLPGVGVPSACNSSEYQAALLKKVNSYMDNHGVGELARRYAYNLANGRFLWRNRVGAEDVEIHISHLKDGKAEKTWTFDGLALSMRNFMAPSEYEADLKELAELIEEGLSSRSHVLLDIEAYVRVGKGQEVFPSQELILDKRSGKGDKSRTLYHVHDVASIHSQKIGNAIRTIDTWYPEVDEVGPIAVEPYGSVTTLGKAYRQPKEKKDFYTLLDNWVGNDKEPDVDSQHYVIAVLIRGGVFGEKE